MFIDLQPFCGTEESRPYLMKPFSLAGYTWATNGHILVRVALRDDVPKNEYAPNVEKILKGHEGVSFAPLPKVKLPDPPAGKCEECDGSGKEHDCPYCECECDACGGTGQEIGRASIGLRGAIFDTKYIRMVLGLPGAEIAVGPLAPNAPTMFRFEGGIGAVMPMRGEAANHLGDIESLPREDA